MATHAEIVFSSRSAKMERTNYRELLGKLPFCSFLASKRGTKEYSTFPWLTPIIGSEGTNNPIVLPSDLYEVLLHQLQAAHMDKGYLTEQEVTRFLINLIKTRSDSADAPREQELTFSKWELQLFNCCAHISDLYYFVKTSAKIPSSRNRETILSIEDYALSAVPPYAQENDYANDPSISRTLKKRIDDTKYQLNNFKAPKQNQSNWALPKAIKKLMDAMENDLDNCIINRLRVLALTEIAWCVLVDKITDGDYHTWLEVLTKLDFYAETCGEVRAKPAFVDLKKAEEDIRDSILLKYKERYANPSYSMDDKAEKVVPQSIRKRYDIYASLTCKEAALAHELFNMENCDFNKNDAPFATVYSTSFDLELEAGMKRKIGKDGRFITIFPVLAISISDVHDEFSDARSFWLGYESDAHPDLSPRPEDFFIFYSDINGNPRLFSYDSNKNTPIICPRDSLVTSDGILKRSIPIIVKLCGSPLITLPDISNLDLDPTSAQGILRTDIIKFFGFENPEAYDFRLEHSLAIEEHHSMVFAFSEFRDYGMENILPRWIISTAPETFNRFFLLLGTQAYDDAVLYRLAPILARYRYPTIPEQRVKISTTNISKYRLGLCILNKLFTSGDSEEFLEWMNIDVVEDDIDAVLEGLEDYVKHIESFESFKKGVLKTKCTMQSTASK